MRPSQDETDHPDFSLYEGFLVYGVPPPETDPAEKIEPYQAGSPDDYPDDQNFSSYEVIDHFTYQASSEPQTRYPDLAGISYDPDLAHIPEIGPDPAPIKEVDEDDEEVRRLEIRASQLVSEISAISESRSAVLHGMILSVLREFPHPASFEAIRRTVLAGHTIEDIVDAAALKALWRDSSDLWLTRKHIRRQGVVIFTNEKMRNSLSWVSALKMIDDHGLVGAEIGMISDWVEGWLSLEPPDRDAPPDVKNEYHSYLAYVLGRADAINMRDPDVWPYQALFDHDPLADPRVRARVVTAAFHEWVAGPTGKSDRSAQASGTEHQNPFEPEADMDDDSADDLTQQRLLEEILMMAAIRGHFG